MAENVLDRWTDHCLAVRDVLEARDLCESADAMRDCCGSKQLVDCYLALALMRGYNAALFVIDSCCRPFVEGQLQREHRATDMQHGLNRRQERYESD